MEGKKYMSLSLDEQETTISFSRTETSLDIWTNDRTMITRLDKLCKTSPLMYVCIDTGKNRDGEIMCKRYKVNDKTLLSFRSIKRKVVLTEEQKKERAERLRKMRDRT